MHLKKSRDQVDGGVKNMDRSMYSSITASANTSKKVFRR